MRRKIKKLTAGILAAAVIVSAGTTSAFAARQGCKRNYAGEACVCGDKQTDCRFTDKDHDGICDSCGREKTSNQGKHRKDTDGDGVCDYKNPSQGTGFCGGRGKQQVKKCGANKR